MGVLEIDAIGLDATDRRLLAAIVQKFGGGPVGVAALGAVLAEEVETVEDVYEPFLLRIGFLDRTPQGRVATDRARAHLASLGYEVPPRRADREPSLWEGGVGPGARRTTPDAAPGGDARPPGGLSSPVPGAARFDVLVPPPADGSTRARVGPPASSPHGTVETPIFMPVGTNATVKALHPDDLDGGRRPDHPGQHLPPVPAPRARADRAPRRPAPVHGLGPTDPHRLGRLPGRLARRSATRSTTTGSPSAATTTARSHRFTPERSIAIQEALGPDVAVAFDQPGRRRRPPIRGDVAIATERTHRWAERSLAAHRRTDQALFGVIQGGLDPELRRRSTTLHRRPAVRRDQHRRPRRRRDAGRARRASSTSSCRSSPTTRGSAT